MCFTTTTTIPNKHSATVLSLSGRRSHVDATAVITFNYISRKIIYYYYYFNDVFIRLTFEKFTRN